MLDDELERNLLRTLGDAAMPRHVRLLPLIAAALLVACAAAPPPVASASPDAPQANTQLRDTIQSPIQRAKAVEGIIQKSHDRQDRQMQGDEGGSASTSSPQ
jgi:hypothetical protein